MRNVLVPLCSFGGRYEPQPNIAMDEAETRILIQACMSYYQPSVLEIGTYRGVTTANMGRVVKAFGGRLITVDVSSIPKTMPHNQTGECLPLHEIGCMIPDELKTHVKQKIMDPDDENSLEEICKTYGPWDIVFIDGDHSYEGVLRDYKVSSKHLKPSGVILLHDIWWDVMPPPVVGPLRLAEETDIWIINGTHLGIPSHHLDRVFPAHGMLVKLGEEK